MTKYAKPVRLLMRDFVAQSGIEHGQVFPRREVVDWFAQKYPRIEPGTITAQLALLSVNAPSRIHLNVRSDGEDDLFFQVDRIRFRLYEPGRDPKPIYSDVAGAPKSSRGQISPRAQKPVRETRAAGRQLSDGQIRQNLKDFMEGTGKSRGIQPEERYASFDYCFNYFQAHREQKSLHLLPSDQRMQVSCLQLGYYLASWGMLRGSGGLFQKSVKAYEPVVRAIAEADSEIWAIDAHCYTEPNIRLLLDFKRAIGASLSGAGGASDILASKIMLGVFGNVPAFDTYFRKGFGVTSFGSNALSEVGHFYEEHHDVIEEHRVPTIEFTTGQPTVRRYTRAKIIDMIFFIEGAR